MNGEELLAVQRRLRKSSPLQLRIGERRAILLLGDLLVAMISLGISLYIWGTSEKFLGLTLEFFQKRVPFWFYLLPIIWLVLLIELYDLHHAADFSQTAKGVLLGALIGLGVYLLLYFYYVDSPRSLLPRRGVASFIISVSLLTLVWRSFYIRIFSTRPFMRRVILVGGGKSGTILLRIVNDQSRPPFTVVGIVDDDVNKLGTEIEGHLVLGTSEHLLTLVEKYHVSDIVVAITGEMQGAMFQTLLDAQECGVEIIRMPVVYEELLQRVPIRLLEADWILRSFVDESRRTGFYEIGKRLLDLIGGLIGLAVFLVVAPFIIIAILLDDGFPILYAQTRSGKSGQPYSILKFRTMRRDAESDGQPRWARENDERATRVGRFLRKTHLDELPQCINVLRGDMSLVGPRAERPELVQVFQRQVPFYRARLLVKPGITGWAQVNFGYAATIEETITKLEYDLYYIKRRSLLLDLVILLRTPATVLGLRGR